MPLIFNVNAPPIAVDLSTGGRFFFRPLTVAELSEIASLTDRMKAAGDGSGALKVLTDTIARSLTGWHIVDAGGNLFAFDAARLPELLTLGEARELLDSLMRANSLTGEERGKSSPASDSPSASPAPVAATGNA